MTSCGWRWARDVTHLSEGEGIYESKCVACKLYAHLCDADVYMAACMHNPALKSLTISSIDKRLLLARVCVCCIDLPLPAARCPSNHLPLWAILCWVLPRLSPALPHSSGSTSSRQHASSSASASSTNSTIKSPDSTSGATASPATASATQPPISSPSSSCFCSSACHVSSPRRSCLPTPDGGGG